MKEMTRAAGWTKRVSIAAEAPISTVGAVVGGSLAVSFAGRVKERWVLLFCRSEEGGGMVVGGLSVAVALLELAACRCCG